MGLVKVEEYSGDLIATTVSEALEMIGIINKLNLNGYHLSLLPILDKYPKGMVEEEASKHSVKITRNKYVATMSDKEYKKLVKDEKLKDEIYKRMEKADIDFTDDCGATITKEITHDNSGYTWYKHEICMEFERGILEVERAYVDRLLKSIADYVMDGFENTKKLAEVSE